MAFTDMTGPVQFAIDCLHKEADEMGINADMQLITEVNKQIEPQGYHRSCRGNRITITGGDEAGIMYGILDLSREICHNRGWNNIADTKVMPFIKNRGIKFNIPLDARTPSYSDASDSAFHNIANVWDYGFWTEFLDRMALDRYNVLSLWTLSLFPSLVRIPKYPLTALLDVKASTRPAKPDLSGWGMYSEDMSKSLVTLKKMTIEDKIAFWQSVMEYAAKRCIKLFLFTWNLFVYGTEGNPYKITCDQNNPVTLDYIYHGTKALMDTYPLLAGIGITSGEHMLREDSDIEFLAASYGKGVSDYLKEHPGRSFRFIHRMQYTRYDSIIREFTNLPCPFEISFKYSQAHMYSSTRPAFIDNFLKEKKQELKIWLTVRNDDFYMFRWGNPQFAREYIRQMPVDDMTGFYMGADGYTWGRDYMNLRDTSHPLYIAKMWFMFRIWGQLSYNTMLSDEYFMKELECRFQIKPECRFQIMPECRFQIMSKCLFEAFMHASMIIPELNRVHWHDYDFQWYPEGCCMYEFEYDKLVFADINEFVRCPAMPGEDILSVREYCEAMLRGDTATKADPMSIAESIKEHADTALDKLSHIRKDISLQQEQHLPENIRQEQHLPENIQQEQHLPENIQQELLYTLDDLEAMSYLGQYYSVKLRAAVSLCIYRLSGERSYQETAVELLCNAYELWTQYSLKTASMYRPQLLTRLCGYVNVQRFDTNASMDALLALEDKCF